MDNKKSYVYKISCKITGEFYFGSSFYAKRNYYWGSGRKIKERISKYGKENFVKEILGEFDDRTIAHQVENQYIEEFRHDDNCLNERLERHFGSYGEESCAKRSASHLGKHFSEEHRAKISAANSGKHRTDEFRAKLSAANLGKHHTEETRAKLSAANRGKTFSKEHRAKISAALRGEKNPMYGKILSEETRAKISTANSGKHFSEEHRAKLSATHRGKHWRKNPITGKREWYD